MAQRREALLSENQPLKFRSDIDHVFNYDEKIFTLTEKTEAQRK